MKRACLILAIMVPGCSQGPAANRLGSPSAAVDSLLATDRAFAAAAAGADVVGALTAMMSADVVMPAPGGGFVHGRDSVAALLRTHPDNLTSRVEWAPIRAAISADAQQGFTQGYMEARGAGGEVTPMKYISYWRQTPEGWRVAVYKRSPRPPGSVSTEVMAPLLPARLVPAVSDPAVIQRFADELASVEHAFSDEARKIGLGPAFEQFGSPVAMNIGGPKDTAFVAGAIAIAASVSAGETGPATISWGPEQVIVASSGDLGVSIGFIVPDPDPSGAPPPRWPFFTIWRRDSTSAPWRYVAE